MPGTFSWKTWTVLAAAGLAVPAGATNVAGSAEAVPAPGGGGAAGAGLSGAGGGVGAVPTLTAGLGSPSAAPTLAAPAAAASGLAASPLAAPAEARTASIAPEAAVPAASAASPALSDEAVPLARAAALAGAPAAGAPASSAELPGRAEGDARAFDGNVAAGGVDVLASERPTFTARELERVERTDQALTAAALEAAAEAFGAKIPFEATSRGSTSRRTYVGSNPDYDVSVALPRSWSPAEFGEFVGARAEEFKAALARAASRAGARLFPAASVRVSVEGPLALVDATTRLPSEGAALFPVKIFVGERGSYAKVDVTLTNSPVYSNPYPRYFEAQMRQVAARDGGAAAERVLDDIRLAKRFFKDAVGAYKFYEGGPSAVGVEQMVLQSGRVADSDLGRTVLETGSFDKMMARIDAAAYDQNGSPRTFDEFQAAWTVHNAFGAPANVLSLLGPSWRRAAALARSYLAARRAGRPITFNDLAGRARGADVGALEGPTRKIVVRLLRREGRKFEEKQMLRQFELRAGLGTRVTRESDGKGGVTVTLEFPAALDVEAQAKWARDFFSAKTNVTTLVSVDSPAPEGAAPAR